ncbi:4'-phosphopantetheinyl transferase family protein [Paludibacterium yongneupense]|uniref:4'-phosphopantetheinyl transferase family protein n=1 Tax=Paludibacterium yongneupense TaxID=400061 RepID=UPI00040717B9|nr:4'-phosphopantetheinyl transferase superfamily protein [Paludibacterium yongneupense]
MPNVIILIARIAPATPENRALHHSLQSERARQLIAPACALLDASATAGWRIDQGSPPQLLQEDGQPAPGWISLSHSDCWVGCLVSLAGPAGFDLETCQHREFSTLLDYLASKREQKWLQRRFGDDPAQRFYACWTLKEALGKLYRSGWDASTSQLDLTGLDRTDNSEAAIQAMHLTLPEWELALSCALRSPAPLSPRLFVSDPQGKTSPLVPPAPWTSR